MLAACGTPATGGDPPGSDAAPAAPAPVVVVAAGDIGASPEAGAETARLVESMQPEHVLALGDNAYDTGSTENYAKKYDPTWGAFKDITRPVPGNHEYRTDGAAGYKAYFGADYADPTYYAWDAGGWRLYALDCEIDCGKGSAQAEWLADDLAAHPDQPALAYVHQPRFTCSKPKQPFTGLKALWRQLDAAGGQVVLAGHAHSYERFAPMDAGGSATEAGIRQFVVGTGGAGLYQLREDCENREAGDDSSFGVLRLVLTPTAYAWEFVDTDGTVVDSGRQRVA